MTKFFSVLATLVLALGLAAAAGADDDGKGKKRGHHKHAQFFGANLTPGQEVQTPPVSSTARGKAVIRLNRARDTLHYAVAVRNIDKVVAAHIHCAPRGQNGPIVADLHPKAGATATTTATTFRVRGTITAADVKAQTCKNRKGENVTVSTFQDLVKLLRHRLAYVNVHTTDYPGGEVRGQIHRLGHGR